jgi:hypothetical protein
MTLCEISVFCHSVVKIFALLIYYIAQAGSSCYGRLHIGPIFNIKMFKKKEQLNPWQWDQYAATKQQWQTNLYYATTQDILCDINYNTQKRGEHSNIWYSKLSQNYCIIIIISIQLDNYQLKQRKNFKLNMKWEKIWVTGYQKTLLRRRTSPTKFSIMCDPAISKL